MVRNIQLDYDLFRKNEIYKVIAHYNNCFQDLKNYEKLSNPSISTTLVNLIKECDYAPDVQIFKKAVIDGRFYEDFGELLRDKNLLPNEILGDSNKIRKFAKTAIFTAFFSKQKGVYRNKRIEAFQKCFPTVFRIFNLIKTGNGKKDHATMALLLQRFESNLVLHGVCMEINSLYPNAPLFTIHDSIASTAENIPNFERVFKKHLFEKLGVYPQLEVENW